MSLLSVCPWEVLSQVDSTFVFGDARYPQQRILESAKRCLTVYSEGHPGDTQGHPAGTQEAPTGTQEHTGGTQEAPRGTQRHQGLQRASGRHLEVRSQKTSVPLELKANPFKSEFHNDLFMVLVIMFLERYY